MNKVTMSGVKPGLGKKGLVIGALQHISSTHHDSETRSQVGRNLIQGQKDYIFEQLQLETVWSTFKATDIRVRPDDGGTIAERKKLWKVFVENMTQIVDILTARCRNYGINNSKNM